MLSALPSSVKVLTSDGSFRKISSCCPGVHVLSYGNKFRPLTSVHEGEYAVASVFRTKFWHSKSIGLNDQEVVTHHGKKIRLQHAFHSKVDLQGCKGTVTFCSNKNMLKKNNKNTSTIKQDFDLGYVIGTFLSLSSSNHNHALLFNNNDIVQSFVESFFKVFNEHPTKNHTTHNTKLYMSDHVFQSLLCYKTNTKWIVESNQEMSYGINKGLMDNIRYNIYSHASNHGFEALLLCSLIEQNKQTQSTTNQIVSIDSRSIIVPTVYYKIGNGSNNTLFSENIWVCGKSVS